MNLLGILESIPITKDFDVEEKLNIWNFIKKAFDKNALMGCGINVNIGPLMILRLNLKQYYLL